MILGGLHDHHDGAASGSPAALPAAAVRTTAGRPSRTTSTRRHPRTFGKPVPPTSPMTPVSPDAYGTRQIIEANRRETFQRRARLWQRWWLPPLLLLLAVCGCWRILKVDQTFSEQFIWPTRGARFIEISSSLNHPDRPGGSITIVVGGLNRASGTGVAFALLPSLEINNSRVFSLVYGSGIDDQDIVNKFDALVGAVHPREVTFFGSSMGGDVALELAAHAQQSRDEYWQTYQQTLDPMTGIASLLGHALMPTAIHRDVGAAAHGVAVLLIGSDTPGAISPDAARSRAAPDPTSAAGPPPDDPTTTDTVPPPRLGVIFLDCTPLNADDVRDSSRTKADTLTALTESLHTDGGALARLAAETLAQQRQWSSGRFPFLQIRYSDLLYKIKQVLREKLGTTGVSTQLVKDQYGVIRRIDIDAVTESFHPGTPIVYFLPQNPADDHTVRVEQVQTQLNELGKERDLTITFVPIPGGSHASAESKPDTYRRAINRLAEQ